MFGKRRNVNGTDDAGKITLGNNIKGQFPRRGYTGHEMLDSLSLVHMNGRLYDPGLGRVLSADPIIQAPDMSQNYNRYSYVMNSPLSLTDPSGYSWWTSFRDKWLKPIAAISAAIFAPQISGFLWGEAFGVASACYAVSASTVAIVQGATAGFLAGAITGGTVESAFIGGISGAAFGGLHAGMDPGVAKVLAHGMAGGIMGAAQGGDFGSSFLSAAFTQGMSQANVFGNPGAGLAMRVQNAVLAAIIGGTAAALGGGKFANGAVTGAMSRLLNDEAAGERLKSSQERHEEGVRMVKESLQLAGYEIVGEEVVADIGYLPFSRKYDLLVYDPKSKEYVGVEVKTSIRGIFSLKVNQVIFDGEANIYGATTRTDNYLITRVAYVGVSAAGIAITTWSAQSNAAYLRMRGIEPQVSIKQLPSTTGP